LAVVYLVDRLYLSVLVGGDR